MKKLEWTTTQRKVNDLLEQEINPRKITDAERQRLMASLEKFNLADIPVINYDSSIISGHQRVAVLKMLGRGEELIDVRTPNRKLTLAEVKEYMLIANTHSGVFDLDILQLEFADIDMEIAGINLKQIEFESSDAFDKQMDTFFKRKQVEDNDIDYSGKNKEIDTDAFEDTMTISLKYTHDEYMMVREQLSKIAQTPEQAVWKLLGNE